MAEKTWPALESCKRKCNGANGGVVSDRMNQLPHDILLSIISSLTMKEATRTSVLSQRWKHLWRYFPALVFETDSSALKRIKTNRELLLQERSGFTRRVNNTVDAHLGTTIDELRVIYDLDCSCQSDIDKWLVFALAKQVKRLELNLTPFSNRSISLLDCYVWPLECCMLSLGLPCKLASLSSLCLKYVNVTIKDIECILLSCTVLESLCIVNGSVYLTDIKLPHTPLQLKHLEVSCCPRLLCIDILAPKLVSFTRHGVPIELCIRDSSLLSEVSIGNGDSHGEVVDYAYKSLSKYFSQLEHLSYHLRMHYRYNEWRGLILKSNLGIKNPVVMTNLKHLQLHVEAKFDDSLLGWADFIEASPVLQKLYVEFSVASDGIRDIGSSERTIVKRKGHPLTSLKTVEIVGFGGLPINVEFVTYVVENSVMLSEVILVNTPMLYVPYWRLSKCIDRARKRAEELKRTLSEDVTFKYVDQN